MLKKVASLDYVILGILLVFLFMSTAIIYSATFGNQFSGLHIKNLILFSASFIPLLAFALIDYRIWVRYLSYILYGLGVLLLLYVMYYGVEFNGARRWFNIHSFQFQPSEIMKLFIIFAAARFLSGRNGESLRLIREIGPLVLLFGIPLLLIMKQPDLGTSIVFISIFIGMVWVGNIRFRHVLLGLAIFAAAIALVISLYFVNFDLFSKIVKPHQLTRIQTFLDPSNNPNDSWHVTNSIAAVSSGQLYGEGFQRGQFVQNGFIPYDYADSIFVVIGEEFGFLGSSILLLLYFLLIYRMVMIAMKCKEPSGVYIIVGVVSMLSLQIFENIAMHTGLMPLTGIALPFISYGGSSLVTNMMAMGLVLSVKTHTENNHLN